MATKQTPKVTENAVIRWAARAAGLTVANRGAIPGKVAAWWIAKSDASRQRLMASYRSHVEQYGEPPTSGDAAVKIATPGPAPKPRARRERLTATQRRDALVAIGDAIEQTIKMLEESRELVLALINAR